MRLFIVLTLLVVSGLFVQAVAQRIRSRGTHQIREVKLGEISDASKEAVAVAARQFRAHGVRARAEAGRASIVVRRFLARDLGGRSSRLGLVANVLRVKSWQRALSCSAHDAEQWRDICRQGGDVGEVAGLTRARKWILFGFSHSDARLWASRGFSALESQQWVVHGFPKPEDAEQWKMVGPIQIVDISKWRSHVDDPSPEELREWVNAGFGEEVDEALWYRKAGVAASAAAIWRTGFANFRLARPWIDSSWKPRQALNWVNAGFADKIEDAVLFREAGIDASTAGVWLSGFQSFALAEKWVGSGLTPHEAANWGRAGFADKFDVAKEFRQRNFDVVSAADWYRALRSPETAELWRDAGFTSTNATKWNSVDFTPSKAKEFLDNHLSVAVAQEWRDWSDNVASIVQWRTAGFQHPAAARWRDAGFAPHQAREWARLSIGPHDAVGFYRLGVSAEQAVKWLGVFGGVDAAEAWILDKFAANVAGGWYQRGFDSRSAREFSSCGLSVDDAVEWRSWPFGVEKIPQWLGAGFQAPAAALWLEAGFSPTEAAPWREIGGPSQAQSWRDAGFGAEEASRWASCGFAPNEANAMRPFAESPSTDLYEAVRAVTPLDRVIAWLKAGVKADRISVEAARWDDRSFLEWTNSGELEADVAYAWYQVGVDRSSIQGWLSVEATPQHAKALEDLGYMTADYSRIVEIFREEIVEIDEAVWRYAIEQAGYSRDKSTPIFYCESGAGTVDEVREFLAFVSESGTDVAKVWHDAPRLSRAMLDALPDARPVRGGVKKVIWGEQVDPHNYFEFREVESYFTVRPRTASEDASGMQQPRIEGAQ